MGERARSRIKHTHVTQEEQEDAIRTVAAAIRAGKLPSPDGTGRAIIIADGGWRDGRMADKDIEEDEEDKRSFSSDDLEKGAPQDVMKTPSKKGGDTARSSRGFSEAANSTGKWSWYKKWKERSGGTVEEDVKAGEKKEDGIRTWTTKDGRRLWRRGDVVMGDWKPPKKEKKVSLRRDVWGTTAGKDDAAGEDDASML